MFVDASALVAILAGKEEDAVLFACLDAADQPITLISAIFEAAT